MKKSKKTMFFTMAVFILVISIPLYFLYKNYLSKILAEKHISCLTYRDLVKLSQEANPQGSLYSKLQKQLSNPYVLNRALGSKLLNPYIRITHWNIERGYNIEKIKNIFTNKAPVYNQEISDFIKSDIISLNEVDVGMPRTKYKNVVSELADSINYNYAFATEFVELNPIYKKESHDPEKFLGLHGNAVLSKYPIKSAWTVRLPNCYPWYESESNGKSPLEHGRRFGAMTVFRIGIKDEVRHGSRCALITNIELPNREILTVVSTHLEDKCYPSCRLKQMQYLLLQLKNVRSPLVLAGDLNTSTTDTAPISVKKEVTKRIKDPHFIARQLALALIPGIPPLVGNIGAAILSKTFQYKDPTVPGIPILFPNQERKLFNFVEDFRFNDGEGFDFSGDRSSNGKSGLLANSNERQLKGFESTFRFEKPYVVGYFKLDWFFVKPKYKRFKPFRGQTLKLVNEVYKNRISDHDPITVDISL